MNHITGVIDELDSIRFKRMVFRVTRGNSYIGKDYINTIFELFNHI